MSAWLRRVYDWYSFRLLPAIGTWVARDHTDVYRYLPESIRTFPDQEQLATMLREAGFGRVEYHNLSGGIVAIHVAVKPVEGPVLSPELVEGSFDFAPLRSGRTGGKDKRGVIIRSP